MSLPANMLITNKTEAMRQQEAANILLSTVRPTVVAPIHPIVNIPQATLMRPVPTVTETTNGGPSLVKPGANVAPVDVADKPTINPVLVGAVGLGALWLLMGKGGSVGSVEAPKKNFLIPVLILGGAAAFWWLNKNKTAEAPPSTELPYSTVDPYTSNTKPPPVIEAPPAVSQQVLSYAASNNLSYLQNAFPALSDVYPRMTESEIVALYQYLYGYVSQGRKLYQYPTSTGIFSDGGWDTNLFNAITAIKAKYNLNI